MPRRHAEVSDQPENGIDQIEHRLCDEAEPTPIDRKVESVEMERFVVAVEDRDFLGAGEQPSGGARSAAGLNGQRILHIVGLIGLE